ncbi:hypothetical protein BCR39DRAFT_560795 [Naematelia encephala]|uniref:F-box domain-containing protein n=1 Tax=Naematelia encephala TaxID=71784 RepID=A0A1Y2AUP0_9TREE|nr:hypothetical protein BCR39DRAFT_560795 [Naematelia encephala]
MSFRRLLEITSTLPNLERMSFKWNGHHRCVKMFAEHFRDPALRHTLPPIDFPRSSVQDDDMCGSLSGIFGTQSKALLSTSDSSGSVTVNNQASTHHNFASTSPIGSVSNRAQRVSGDTRGLPSLPVELIVLITSYNNREDRRHLSETCRTFRKNDSTLTLKERNILNETYTNRSGSFAQYGGFITVKLGDRFSFDAESQKALNECAGRIRTLYLSTLQNLKLLPKMQNLETLYLEQRFPLSATFGSDWAKYLNVDGVSSLITFLSNCPAKSLVSDGWALVHDKAAPMWTEVFGHALTHMSKLVEVSVETNYGRLHRNAVMVRAEPRTIPRLSLLSSVEESYAYEHLLIMSKPSTVLLGLNPSEVRLHKTSKHLTRGIHGRLQSPLGFVTIQQIEDATTRSLPTRPLRLVETEKPSDEDDTNPDLSRSMLIVADGTHSGDPSADLDTRIAKWADHWKNEAEYLRFYHDPSRPYSWCFHENLTSS